MEWGITPAALSDIGVVGLVVLIFLMIVFGKGLALMREVKERDNTINILRTVEIPNRDETIEWQRKALDEKDRHIADLIGGTRVSTESLRKVSQAAEQIASGGDGL